MPKVSRSRRRNSRSKRRRSRSNRRSKSNRRSRRVSSRNTLRRKSRRSLKGGSGAGAPQRQDLARQRALRAREYAATDAAAQREHDTLVQICKQEEGRPKKNPNYIEKCAALKMKGGSGAGAPQQNRGLANQRAKRAADYRAADAAEAAKQASAAKAADMKSQWCQDMKNKNIPLDRLPPECK